MPFKSYSMSATAIQKNCLTRDDNFNLACCNGKNDTVNSPYAYIPASTASRTISAALGTFSRFIKMERCILMVRSLRPSS